LIKLARFSRQHPPPLKPPPGGHKIKFRIPPRRTTLLPTARNFLTAAALLLIPAVAQAQDKVVNIYNWSDYIGEGVLEDFTKETGIQVVYDTYDSMEMMETKLLAGGSGYDIIVPTDRNLARLIQAGRVPEAGQIQAAQPAAPLARKSPQRLANYDRATSTQPTTCGAQRRSATMWTRSRSACPMRRSTPGT
jgi:hypothetical protein